jgi:nicotinate-nucleotide--dimethylbenzimidazole phosphoribosyltransferase
MLARPAAVMAALLVLMTLDAGIAAAAPAASAPTEPPPAEPAAEPDVPQPAVAIDEASAACAPAEPETAGPADELEAAPPSDPPVAVCSQNAGDEQYEDPFANEKPPAEQQGGGNGSGSEGQVSQTGPADAPATTTDGTGGVPSTEGAPQLPSTGLDAFPPALLGILLLLGGAALRRRAAAASPTNVA